MKRHEPVSVVVNIGPMGRCCIERAHAVLVAPGENVGGDATVRRISSIDNTLGDWDCARRDELETQGN